MPQIEKILKEIGKNFSPLKISVKGVCTVGNKNTSVFDIALSNQLYKLHITVMRELLPFFLHVIPRKSFWKVEPSKNSMCYVTDFPSKYAFCNFWPHITLGDGEIEQIRPFTFIGSRLALSQLGVHGTCAEVLWSTELK